MIFHLVFLSWSKFLSWFFFIGDLFVMVWLALKAYQDADTLDRYVLLVERRMSPLLGDIALTMCTRFEVPVLGALASRILDDE